MAFLHSTGGREHGSIPRGGSIWGALAFQRAAGALLTGVLGLGIALWAPTPAEARNAIYSYTDDDGVTHFTNIPRGDSRFRRVAVPDRKRYRAPRRSDYDALIGAIAAEHAVPPALVKAVIAAESAFNPSAVSHKGAQGLMQLMPKTAASLGVSNAMVPEENVRGGVTYLRRMIDRFGSWSNALAAYNAGPAAVDRYGGIPPYRETRDYVARVLNYYRAYHGDFAR